MSPVRKSLCAFAAAASILLGAPCTIAAAGSPSPRPLHYMISCEGCHKADGSGQPGFVPEFRNHVASYLTVPGGRAYLIGVPGVAQSDLGNQELADVMNWLLQAYDPSGLPERFEPFTASEVEVLRKSPVSDTVNQRARLLAMMVADAGSPVVSDSSVGGTSPAVGAEVAAAVEPPASFAICAACHSVSADGANAMGPNLRGVVGRTSGTHSGFAYSKSMQSAAIVWTESALDGFIASPGKAIPNTTMAFMGEPDAQKRAEIIRYLKSLE